MTAGSYRKTRWHREDLIRLSGLPAIGKRRKRRFIAGVALRRAVLGPSPDQSNLIVRQAPLVGKLTVSRFRFPWWHEATLRRAGDQLRTLCCIFISEQREWRYFAGTMAGRTVLIKKRRDMLVERRYIGCTRSHTEDDRCDEYRRDLHWRGMNHCFNLSAKFSRSLSTFGCAT